MRWRGCEGNGCGRAIKGRLCVRKRAFAGLYLRGFGPGTPRSFCFGKRTPNHGRPGMARVQMQKAKRAGRMRCGPYN